MTQPAAPHAYHCGVDAGGDITFGYDSQVFDILFDSMWVGTTATSASWTGELYTRESDMPGTQSFPCVMSDCQYKQVGGNFQPANMSTAGNDDPQEWEIVLDQNGTRVTFWDINPLP